MFSGLLVVVWFGTWAGLGLAFVLWYLFALFCVWFGGLRGSVFVNSVAYSRWFAVFVLLFASFDVYCVWVFWLLVLRVVI